MTTLKTKCLAAACSKSKSAASARATKTLAAITKSRSKRGASWQAGIVIDWQRPLLKQTCGCTNAVTINSGSRMTVPALKHRLSTIPMLYNTASLHHNQQLTSKNNHSIYQRMAQLPMAPRGSPWLCSALAQLCGTMLQPISKASAHSAQARRLSLAAPVGAAWNDHDH